MIISPSNYHGNKDKWDIYVLRIMLICKIALCIIESVLLLAHFGFSCAICNIVEIAPGAHTVVINPITLWDDLLQCWDGFHEMRDGFQKEEKVVKYLKGDYLQKECLGFSTQTTGVNL